jgi:hypothetical protein
MGESKTAGGWLPPTYTHGAVGPDIANVPQSLKCHTLMCSPPLGWLLDFHHNWPQTQHLLPSLSQVVVAPLLGAPVKTLECSLVPLFLTLHVQCSANPPPLPLKSIPNLAAPDRSGGPLTSRVDYYSSLLVTGLLIPSLCAGRVDD